MVNKLKATDAFQAFNTAMTTTLVLTLLNVNDAFTIQTYVSHVEIEVVLMQHGHPVAFISKSLSKWQHRLLVYRNNF